MSGNACVIGLTVSTDFPILNALQPGYAGPDNAQSTGFGDYFVTKLNSEGSGLIFSTYLGGTGGGGVCGVTSYSGGITAGTRRPTLVFPSPASNDSPMRVYSF